VEEEDEEVEEALSLLWDEKHFENREFWTDVSLQASKFAQEEKKKKKKEKSLFLRVKKEK